MDRFPSVLSWKMCATDCHKRQFASSKFFGLLQTMKTASLFVHLFLLRTERTAGENTSSLYFNAFRFSVWLTYSHNSNRHRLTFRYVWRILHLDIPGPSLLWSVSRENGKRKSWLYVWGCSANLKTRSIRSFHKERRNNNVPTKLSPCNIDYYGIFGNKLSQVQFSPKPKYDAKFCFHDNFHFKAETTMSTWLIFNTSKEENLKQYDYSKNLNYRSVLSLS